MDTKQAAITAPNIVHISALTPLTLVSPLHINIGDWLELSDLSPWPVSGSKTTSYPIPCPPCLKFTKFKHVTLLCGQSHQPATLPHSSPTRGEREEGKWWEMRILSENLLDFTSYFGNSFLSLVTVIQCYTSALLPLPSKNKTNKWLIHVIHRHITHHRWSWQ